MSKRAPFVIGDFSIAPGDRKTVDLPVCVLSNHTPITLPVQVIHGKTDGPTMFVSAAIHGDEIIGVEIIRRLLTLPELGHLKGTLLAVPIVNAFGFISHSRYLPDRRDLNRCFPGSAKGSLAAQLANLFLNEVVARSDVGIDLHSAATHRINLPQIRVAPDNPQLMKLAHAFNPPVILIAPLRDGSLRDAAAKVGTGILLFEGGEALRFDEFSIRSGMSGILHVMEELGMLDETPVQEKSVDPAVSKSSRWLRAPAGGILRTYKTIGASVEKDDVLGVIADPFGETETEVLAIQTGIIIGNTNLPVVNQGDGLFHIARVKEALSAEENVETIELELQSDALYDEDEIN